MFGICLMEFVIGFGYIQCGDVLGDGYQVMRFMEKFDIEIVVGFIV